MLVCGCGCDGYFVFIDASLFNIMSSPNEIRFFYALFCLYRDVRFVRNDNALRGFLAMLCRGVLAMLC